MSEKPGEVALAALIESLTAREMRVAGFAAFHDFAQYAEVIKPDALGTAFIREMVRVSGRGVAPGEQLAMEGMWRHLLTQVKPARMTPVADFVWSFVRAGLAVPVPDTNGWHVPHVILTKLGRDVLTAPPSHPLLPGAVERVAADCAGLPAPLVRLLSDASDCLGHGLLHPAIALLGFAYEGTVDEVLDRLETLGYVKTKIPTKAWERLKLLRTTLPAVFAAKEKEEHERATLACDLAELIRDRRNEASHPRLAAGFSDREAVEEYLASGFRRLPDLWGIAPR